MPEEFLSGLEDAIDEAESFRKPKTSFGHREELLIAALLHSATLEDAAEKCNVSIKTLRRYLKDPEFVEKFQETKQMALANAIVNLQMKFGAIVEKLFEFVMDDDWPPPSRVQAAGILMKHGLEMIKAERDQAFVQEIKAFICEMNRKREEIGGAKQNLLALAEKAEVIETEYKEFNRDEISSTD